MKYKVLKSEISGSVLIPPSKSHTLRAILFSLMANGKSIIRNYLVSGDTIAMIDAIEKFGAKVKIGEGLLEIDGVARKLQRPTDVIQAGNSGQVLRFIAGIAAIIDSYVVITGDESIRTRRPVKALLDALTSQNVFAESAPLNGHAPIIIKGPMKPGVMAIDGFDSQPVSALLIAMSFLEDASELYVMNPGEKPWINVTLSWLSNLGIKVANHDYRHYKVFGKASYNGFDVTIPGDFSTACYPMAAAIISKKSVQVFGLDMEDPQPDKQFIEIIRKMGVFVTIYPEEHCIEVNGACELRGIDVNINDCIDTLPILAVIACFATTATYITGAKVARYKESDRIASIAEELRKMGAQIEEKEDGLIIHPSRLKGAALSSHKDHRIALSLLVAGLGSSGETIVDGIECIGKTYPTFFYDFICLGARIE